ncbi:MAG: EamA family transporter [Rhizobiaceae bacterium]
MSAMALLLALGAATLHATWNALVKGAGDRVLTMGAVIAGHAMAGLFLCLISAPPAPESWPFIAASVVIHWLYYGFLIAAYRVGDLSFVYPIARGVAPVLVSLSAWLWADEQMSGTAWTGILLVSGAIFLLATGRQMAQARSATVMWALLAGLTIAAYSVVDGIGVRASGNNAPGYIGWLFLAGSPISLAFLWQRRQVLGPSSARALGWGLAGGIVSAAAYGMAILAMQIAALGAVSAVRESSVIIAALIGVVWFRERPWQKRLLAAAMVVCGVVLLVLATR